MKLNSLEIEINNKLQRVVKFHDGLNLITNRPESGRTGNSVGKSTLSRVVDFLFLGSIGSIYIDEEFKKPNKDIEMLFIDNNVTATLFFTDNKDNKHHLKRNFSIGDTPEIFSTDDLEIDKKDYEKFIQKNCFDINTRRPSAVDVKQDVAFFNHLLV